jgi:hypothetical protein
MMPMAWDFLASNVRGAINEIEGAGNWFLKCTAGAERYKAFCFLNGVAISQKSEIAHAAAAIEIDVSGFLEFQMMAYSASTRPPQRLEPTEEQYADIRAAWPKAYAALNRLRYGLTASERKLDEAGRRSQELLGPMWDIRRLRYATQTDILQHYHGETMRGYHRRAEQIGVSLAKLPNLPREEYPAC